MRRELLSKEEQREEALQAFTALREKAKEVGVAGMSEVEINKEIEATRYPERSSRK